MKKAQFNERECALFWEISGELLAAARDHQPQKTIEYLLDEIEGIRVNTEQFTLRKRCADLQAQFRIAETMGVGCSSN